MDEPSGSVAESVRIVVSVAVYSETLTARAEANTGASLTEVIVRVTLDVLESAVPSLALNAKLSDPL